MTQRGFGIEIGPVQMVLLLGFIVVCVLFIVLGDADVAVKYELSE